MFSLFIHTPLSKALYFSPHCQLYLITRNKTWITNSTCITQPKMYLYIRKKNCSHGWKKAKIPPPPPFPAKQEHKFSSKCQSNKADTNTPSSPQTIIFLFLKVAWPKKDWNKHTVTETELITKCRVVVSYHHPYVWKKSILGHLKKRQP